MRPTSYLGAITALAVAFVAALAVGAGPAAGATGPSISVDASAGRHAISPYVYGLNGAAPAVADDLDLPVDRWGGNLFETYNFTLGAVNTASDYYYENIADCTYFSTGCNAGNVPYYRSFIKTDVDRGTAPLMQLPMAGYVAKDAPKDHPFTCGFPTSVDSTQTDHDQYDASCGNGVHADTTRTSSDPTRDGVAITATDRKNWITDLASRGAHLFELGNEPALWNDTHRDIHPDPTTYDELWSKSKTLAEAVKDNDPRGQVIGFSEFGWPAYFCSAKDVDHPDGYCGDGQNTDRAAHGNVPLVNWLLQQFKAQSTTEGRRLLDYIDVHYYVQGRDSGNPMNVTRSLWDPSYTDPSYIDTPIQLIRRMHDWVSADYPGTKTSLSEYDLLDPSLTGRQNAIIQADTLGIFGREGLDLATFWDEGYGGAVSGAAPTLASPILNAFRMFRNYDGAGHGFGQTSISSTSADQSKLAVYGAQRTDGALTILVLNKTAGVLHAPLSVTGGPAAAAVQTYRWTGGAITRDADTAALPAAADFPAQSMTLYVVVPGAPAPTPTVTATPTPTPASTATPMPTSTSTPNPSQGTGAGALSGAPGEPSGQVGASPSPAPTPTLTGATASRTAVAPGEPVTFSASTSGPGTVKIVISRSTAGRKVSGVCKPQTAKNRSRKSCRYDRVITTLQRAANAGTLTVTFSGKVGRKKLAAGTYKATIQVTSASGVASAATVLTFRVRAKPKR